MKHSERFTNAVTKLYNAFHQGELEQLDCTKCAVGSIVGNDKWSNFRTLDCNYMTIISSPRIGKENIKFEGYSVEELCLVEERFMNSYEDETKEEQFKGLCAVIEYLCELEGIPNVMDYQSLFETENNQPKHNLETILI